MTTYEELVHEGSPEGGAPSLRGRLVRFRKWATKKAGIAVHSAVCVVNGEATDGQRNAPVLLLELPRPDPRGGLAGSVPLHAAAGAQGGGPGGPPSEVRCGAIDEPADRAMYDRTIGCQVRTVRELKKGEVALSIPGSAMVTPDLIAASDAGWAVYRCCRRLSDGGDANDFWEAFGATGQLEKNQLGKIQQSNGTQLLVKILQQRKQVETTLARAERIAIETRRRGGGGGKDGGHIRPAPPGIVSRRAPFLAFLVHQRFAAERDPPVASEEGLGGEGDDAWDGDGVRPVVPDGVPATFAPYTRSLPPSTCLPICWRRNELALLAGCIPGMPALQKVAARTMQLAAEVVALVEAGLLWRFPDVFPPGTITWDRWVWAAAAYESRALPASSLPARVREGIGSPPAVVESCGVLVPFLDMINHEDDAAQAQWTTASSDYDDDDSGGAARLNVVTDDRTKKHAQIYRNYGALDNESLVLQYGFARMSNPSDKVRIAWALVDGVGGVLPPADHEPVSDCGGVPLTSLVYDSTDHDAVRAWWTERRIALLGKVTLGDDSMLDSLRKGKKITFCAYNNGRLDPMLLAVAVVAALPHDKVVEAHQRSVDPSSGKPLDGLTLDKLCQNSVRLYLSFLFAKKLGKLLQSLNSCLKDHFNSVQLWTKASSGGLNYVAGKDENATATDGEKSSTVMGWQTFFDTYAWYSTMEVEQRYYSMAPDSCVLTLYDGHVRSLQRSLDVMATDAVFNEKLRQQLVDLGCAMDDAPITVTPVAKEVQPVVTPSLAAAPEKETEELVTIKSAPESKTQRPSPPKKAEQKNGHDGQEDENGNKQRDRNSDNKARTKGERRPAIKLHIGNLSYKTLPNQLYDFFTKLYGKDSVLECHIPTERDTGNSRGFGFVTMPEQNAKAALESGRKHEMDGRILKVAESNSAGSNKGRQLQRNVVPAAPSGDRCVHCGYRPRWCTCKPNMVPMNMGMGPPLPQDNIYGPGPYLPPPPPPMGGPGYGHQLHDPEDRRIGDGYGWSSGGGGGGGGGWGNRRSYSRSPSYRRERDWGGHRRSRSYSRSRSRSYSRGRDRDRHRGRHDDDRRRYDDDRRRGSSRRYRSKSRSRSRQRDGAASPGRRPGDDSGNFSDAPKRRSLSRSRSPLDGNGMDRPSSKKREGKDSSGRGGRSRSRDRGSRRRKRSKGSRRDKGSSSKRRGGSRSRSRDRH